MQHMPHREEGNVALGAIEDRFCNRGSGKERKWEDCRFPGFCMGDNLASNHTNPGVICFIRIFAGDPYAFVEFTHLTMEFGNQE